jgi:hypothetical protein
VGTKMANEFEYYNIGCEYFDKVPLFNEEQQ